MRSSQSTPSSFFSRNLLFDSGLLLSPAKKERRQQQQQQPLIMSSAASGCADTPRSAKPAGGHRHRLGRNNSAPGRGGGNNNNEDDDMTAAGVGGANKRELEKEKSSVSTDSSTNSTTSTVTASGVGSAASSKLSKIGKRLRDSCRHLRGKKDGSGSSSASASSVRHDPEEYATLQAPGESSRSKHYVAMDFTGKVGRIVDHKECPVRGMAQAKDGYTYFRRKVSPKAVERLLTETQATIHLQQPWFHKDVSRDLAQRILNTHNVDGAFLVRESSVLGGFVISYVFNGRTFHAQVLPDMLSPQQQQTGSAATGSTSVSVSASASSNDDDGFSMVIYSLDDGKTKFFDLLQLVEYYQLNRGTLHSKLTHYIVREDDDSRRRPESPVSRSDSSSCPASEASMESQSRSNGAGTGCGSGAALQDDADSAKMDTNHNHSAGVADADAANSNKGGSPAAAAPADADADAAMASEAEGDSDSLRESHQG